MLSYIFYEHENLKILYEIMNSLIFLHRLYLLNWPQQKFNTKWDKCNNFFLFKKAIAQILETLQKYKQLTNKSNQQVRRRGNKEKDMSFCLKVQLSIRFLKKMRSNSNKFFIANNAVIKSCQLSIMSNFGPDHLFDIWEWWICFSGFSTLCLLLSMC